MQPCKSLVWELHNPQVVTQGWDPAFQLSGNVFFFSLYFEYLPKSIPLPLM